MYGRSLDAPQFVFVDPQILHVVDQTYLIVLPIET